MDDPALEKIRAQIDGLDIDTLTPVEALMKLNEIKRMVTPETGTTKQGVMEDSSRLLDAEACYICAPCRKGGTHDMRIFIARVAQLVEHDLAKVGVAGSSPVSRSRRCLLREASLFSAVLNVIGSLPGW